VFWIQKGIAAWFKEDHRSGGVSFGKIRDGQEERKSSRRWGTKHKVLPRKGGESFSFLWKLSHMRTQRKKRGVYRSRVWGD